MKNLFLTLLLVLSGCTGLAHVEARQDDRVAIAELRTFRVLSPDAAGVPERVRAVRREIEDSIARELTAKGYRPTDGTAADFEVEYLAYVTEHYQESAHDHYLFDSHVQILRGSESALANPIREGTLHIHLLRDGRPFYEAVASDIVDMPKPVEKRIRAAVMDMLADLPRAGG